MNGLAPVLTSFLSVAYKKEVPLTMLGGLFLRSLHAKFYALEKGMKRPLDRSVKAILDVFANKLDSSSFFVGLEDRRERMAYLFKGITQRPCWSHPNGPCHDGFSMSL